MSGLGRIEVHESGSVTVTGKAGISLYRLLMIRSAFKLWTKTGLQPTRGVRILSVVKDLTGLKTRDAAKQMERLDLLIQEAESHVVRTGPEGQS